MNNTRWWMSFVAVAALAWLTPSARAQFEIRSALAPPTDLLAVDHPDDAGDQIDLTWTASSEDPGRVTQYAIRRAYTEKELAVLEEAIGTARRKALDAGASDADAAAAEEGARQEWEGAKQSLIDVGVVPAGTTQYTVRGLTPGQHYLFRVFAVDKDGSESDEALHSFAVTPITQVTAGETSNAPTAPKDAPPAPTTAAVPAPPATTPAPVPAPQATPPAAVPAPPANLTATDHPWDGGAVIDLAWDLSRDDATLVKEYVIRRPSTDGELQRMQEQIDEKRKAAIDDGKTNDEADEAVQADRAALEKARTQLIEVKRVPAGTTTLKADQLTPGDAYEFEVAAVAADGRESTAARTASPVTAERQLFAGDRLWLFIILATVCGSIVAFIVMARRGIPLKIRKIAGLEAVDEAVGRATEMGRPVLFIPGIQDMNDMMTLAGITALARVAKTCAEYDAKLEVPTSRSLVMTAARETVQNAFLLAGRPDSYNQDLIYYVTDEQFGFVAYLAGHMAREKPAACFYLGEFYAESLILAETGNSIGAIQIAGTAETAQLPFFVAACDYTLIGEEFYAASAYLSGEPDQLGSLKGQDIGKVIVATGLIAGSVLATLASLMPTSNYVNALEFLKTTMLG